MRLSIPVAAGLEPLVKRQLLLLGYGKAPAENGRITIDGTWEDVARLNVFLRSGERVLIVLATFTATTFDELYDGFYGIEWEHYLKADSKILMDGKSYQSQLAAVKAAGGVAKKAIIRRLADKHVSGSKVFSETGARTIVDFSIFKDRVTVSIDTSGDGLHKRGYRSLAYTAPLKETLAAGIVDLSLYHPDADSEKPFADVFCGSGTLPIEAAMKALHIPPGLNRDFDFAYWKDVPTSSLKKAKEEGMDGIKRNLKTNIFASDINKDAISIAKYHAKRAGVEENIRFAVSDMSKFESRLPYGVLISNPPYGERLLDEREVEPLYRAFGKMFARLPDWSAYVLTSVQSFERFFLKKADRKKRFFNANIECTLFTCFGKKPEKEEE